MCNFSKWELFSGLSGINIFLSGQINTLSKMMKDERMPVLRNLVLFPILVSLDRDESLEVSRFSFDNIKI